MGGRALLRLAAWGVIVAWLLLRPSSADACTSATHEVSRILGFDADGRYVEYHRYENEASEDLPDESFTLYDANDVELGRLTLAWSDKRGAFWRPRGSKYFGHVARGLHAHDAARIEAAILREKKLTMPVRRRALRHVKSEAECGSIELETDDGWLRVADARPKDEWGDCQTSTLSAFEHPKAGVLFVRFVRKVGSGDSLREVDVIERIPKRRIEGITLALRGERARLKGKIPEAIAALEASIDAAPEYLPSRVSLTRAYAKARREPAHLLAALNRPIPEGRRLIGPLPDEALLARLLRAWPGAKLPESLPWPDIQRDGLDRSTFD